LARKSERRKAKARGEKWKCMSKPKRGEGPDTHLVRKTVRWRPTKPKGVNACKRCAMGGDFLPRIQKMPPMNEHWDTGVPKEEV